MIASIITCARLMSSWRITAFKLRKVFGSAVMISALVSSSARMMAEEELMVDLRCAAPGALLTVLVFALLLFEDV